MKKYGGVYLDTDVEIIRDFSEYLEDSSLVLGFESNRLLTTAFTEPRAFPYFFNFIFFKLKDNCFIEQCWFLPNTNMNQP